MTCYFCGFISRIKAAYVLTGDGHIRCKSRDACRRRMRSGQYLKHPVRLRHEAPDVVDPPLVSTDRQRAERNERYRKGICTDCGERRHSTGRPRCDGCHAKMVAYRALGFGDER